MDEFEAIVARIPTEDVPTITETVTVGSTSFVRVVTGPSIKWITVEQ